MAIVNIIKNKLRTFILKKMKKMTDMDIRIMDMRNLGMNVGDNCHIFTRISVNEPTLVTIGNNCTISTDVSFVTHDNSIGFIVDGKTDLIGKITIGNHCFIGLKSIIMLGVTLGDYCVVGAGAVVTRSFPPRSVIAGNPARRICSIDELGEKYKDKAVDFSKISIGKRAEFIENNQDKLIVRPIKNEK